MCKQIIQEDLCQFGEKCAYCQNKRSNLQGLGNEHVQDNINVLKVEVPSLKNTVQSLLLIKEESDHIKNYIRDIKVEIHRLTACNQEL